MLCYAILLLFVSVVASLPHKKYVHSSRKSSYQGTFAVAEYIEDHSLHRLNVRVYIYNNTYVAPKVKDCVFQFHTRPEVNSTDAVVNSLTIDKVVLTWYDELDEPNSRQTRVVTLDMASCKEHSWGPGAQPDALTGNVIVVPEEYNEFRIFTDGNETCRGYGDRCRIGYSLNNKYIGVKSSFDVDFDMSTMNIEYLPNRDLIVRGYKGPDFYRVARVRYHGYAESMFTFAQFGHIRMKSSGTSFCYSNEGRLVLCEFYETQCGEPDGDYVSKRTTFEKKMELIDVYVISKDELVLLTRNEDCADRADCMLYATRVRKGDDEPKHDKLVFECGDDQRNVAVLGVEEFKFGLVYLTYTCRKDYGYTFGGFFL